MANRQKEERARIRAARYAPGRGFYEVTEMTLRNLPRRKHTTIRNKVLAVSSIAATLALLLVFTAPTLVRAAAQLYQRLFSQVVSDIRSEQAMPDDEKLSAMIAAYEGALRVHDVEGASTQVGGVTASVSTVRTSPADRYNEGDKGELDLWLTFSDIPSFDPSWVDFSIVVDAEEIPMRVDEGFQEYRDDGGRTLTAEDWANEFSRSNSQSWEGELVTRLEFDIDSWRWDEPKALELKATIDGRPFSIPFTFDPAKARENAVEMAQTSVKLMGENYRRDKDALETMEAGAAAVGLTGSAHGYDWAISEMSYANESLYFTAAFGGVEEKNPKLAGMAFWLGDVTVDGMMTSPGGSDNGELTEGNYTAVYQCALGRDPGRLPEESLIALSLELGDFENTQRVAFRYNWREKKAALPRNEAEMKAWVEQAEKLHRELYGQYPKNVGYDLTKLNLTREKDGVKMTIIGASFCADVNRLEFYVNVQGDFANSSYHWLGEPKVTINGYRAHDAGGSCRGDDNIPTGYYVYPPLNISEFGDDDKVVFELPLYDKDADFESTNYPEAADALIYEFSIDKNSLEALSADQDEEPVA
jgi:uncharacterized membrane protein YbaN (DUF454 family)